MAAPSLAESLAARLRAGLPAGGGRLPSERMLAGMHGLSRATVRSALQLLAAQGLIARQARSRPTALPADSSGDRLLHVLYATPHREDVDGDPFLGALSMLLAESRMGGLHVLLVRPDDDPIRLLEQAQIRVERTAGVLLAGYSVPYRRLRRHLDARGIPFVLLGEARPGDAVNSVQLDAVGGGRLAAMHLVHHGCRCIALIDGPWDHPSIRQRREGFLTAAGEAGVEATAHACIAWDRDSGRAAIEELLREGRHPDGLVIAGDLASSGALQALHAHGLRSPRDLIVIGVGMQRRAAEMGGLTAIVADMAGLAQAAIHLLGDTGRVCVRVPERLVIGASCGCPLH